MVLVCGSRFSFMCGEVTCECCQAAVVSYFVVYVYEADVPVFAGESHAHEVVVWHIQKYIAVR